MQRLLRSFIALSAAALLAAMTAPGLAAQDAKKPPQPPAPVKKQMAPAHRISNPADVKWGPAPPGLPAEAQFAVLDGDPGKPGTFTARLKAPDGMKVMPHWHPADEHLTIIAGTLMVGMGNKWDDSAMQAVNTGGYSMMPRKQNHYVQMKGETIVQITASGPFAITYANPSDDPRKKKTN